MKIENCEQCRKEFFTVDDKNEFLNGLTCKFNLFVLSFQGSSFMLNISVQKLTFGPLFGVLFWAPGNTALKMLEKWTDFVLETFIFSKLRQIRVTDQWLTHDLLTRKQSHFYQLFKIFFSWSLWLNRSINMLPLD